MVDVAGRQHLGRGGGRTLFCNPRERFPWCIDFRRPWRRRTDARAPSMPAHGSTTAAIAPNWPRVSKEIAMQSQDTDKRLQIVKLEERIAPAILQVNGGGNV